MLESLTPGETGKAFAVGAYNGAPVSVLEELRCPSRP